ncbi:MAG: sensor histidine kinase [Myxococcota bacterium]
MDSSRSLGPLRLLRRIVEARRGDVRAMEDLYHLRGVITFVAIFGATIALPGLLLAYYGIVGIRAEQRANTADVERRANAAADGFSAGLEGIFRSIETATLNRLKGDQSLTIGLPSLNEDLVLVLRFDADGDLVAPFLRGAVDPYEDQQLFFFAPLHAAEEARRLGDLPRAASLFGAAARESNARPARAQAAFRRATALLRAGETHAAEVLLAEILSQHADVRESHGFRLGDLARLKLGEIQMARDPVGGHVALQRHVEALLAEPWVVGRGGEPAVARRAIDLIAGKARAEWISDTRQRLRERSTQLYWAERLLPELDTLGARGRLLRAATGEFRYERSEHALWATTWTDEDQYVLALDWGGVMEQVRAMAASVAPLEGDVVAALSPPDEPLGDDVLARRTLAPWFPGWSLVVRTRDAAALREAQAEERMRGSGIILLSITMIVVGAVLSARLVRRELDAARDKSDFAAHVSHELRSPITQIRLKAEALQLGLATDEDARARHYDVITREAERLSRLVDNVLDFSAIERGRKKYTFRPGDLGGTVRRAVEGAKVAMETRGMTIDAQLPEDLPVVWHDVDAVSQVVTNLLSNAAKYGQEAGWIGVRVQADEGEVQVSVSDRGIGIAPEEQRLVFEQYYRSTDPLARRRKGTGIGLTIVKYIMEAHGGRVSLRSAIGQGSTFTLHFPLKPPASAGAS